MAEGAPGIDAHVLHAGLPVLGICYGMQLLARDLGGELIAARRREFGAATLEIVAPSPLFEDVPLTSRAWMSHGDTVVAPPPGFDVLARTSSGTLAAFGDSGRNMYGVQFHPEVAQTQAGARILANFLQRVAGITPNWQMDTFVDRTIADIRTQIGTGRVICALSGGVDSAVAATLVARAIGSQLTCIFVDTGLLRAGERDAVVAAFADVLHLQVVRVDARQRFLARLAGVVDPEEKRIRIGHEFVAIFEEEAAKLGAIDFLVQGTLYPDVIESKTPASKAGHKIKSHHNVGGLPETMALGLVEPLRLLFKDEVRAVGRVLGLPREIVERQPFPGPGLAVRVLGAITPQRLDTLREADKIVTDEIEAAALRYSPVAVLRRADSAAECRRDGRRPHVCGLDRRTRHQQRGRHDGRLGALTPRFARTDQHANRQRSRRRQSRRIRHHLQTAGDRRVGVTPREDSRRGQRRARRRAVVGSRAFSVVQRRVRRARQRRNGAARNQLADRRNGRQSAGDACPRGARST